MQNYLIAEPNRCRLTNREQIFSIREITATIVGRFFMIISECVQQMFSYFLSAHCSVLRDVYISLTLIFTAHDCEFIWRYTPLTSHLYFTFSNIARTGSDTVDYPPWYGGFTIIIL